MTRGSSEGDLFSIEVNVNADGSPVQTGGGMQFTTDFQHNLRTGRC